MLKLRYICKHFKHFKFTFMNTDDSNKQLSFSFMKKEDLFPILHKAIIDFCECLYSTYFDFHCLDIGLINSRLKSCKFGNFNLYEVIGTQQGFEYILANFSSIYTHKDYRRNLFRSIFILQSIRSIINHPIIVNSFFRSYELNVKLKGVMNSYHTKGLAFDIKRDDFINWNSVTNALKELKLMFQSYPDIINLIEKVDVIEYNTYLHIEIEIEA